MNRADSYRRRLPRLSGTLLVLLATASCESAVSPTGDATLSLQITAASSALARIDEGRIHVEGPTSRTITVTPGTTQTIEGLAPGTYTVALEGFTAGEVETFGERTGISVTAGRNTNVAVSMSSFVSSTLSVPSTSIRHEPLTVQFAAVPGATSYRIEWATNAAFTGLQSTQTATTVAAITLDAQGTNYVRVRAVNRFGSTGRASSNRAIDVIEPAPALAVAPTSLDFGGTVGGIAPPAQTLSISNAGGGTLNWSVSDNASWLTLSPVSGSQTGSVTVTASTTGLSAGSYTGVITVTGNAANSPIAVPVTLTVTQLADFQYSCGSDPVSFQGTAGAANPAPITCSLTNGGGSTLSWSVSDNAPWLSVSPTSGSIGAGQSASLTLTANTAGLASGTYNAAFTISGNGPGLPITVPVTLTLSSQAPLITLSPTSRFFSATAGGTNPPSQTVSVTNGGGGTLSGLSASINYLSGQPTGWLTASLGATTAPATLTLSVAAGSLVPGTYNATVLVASPAAGNSPQPVAVSFTVNQAAPVIEVSATSFSFVGVAGQANPPNQTLSISNSGGGTLNWSVSDDASWLSLSPGSGSQSGTVTLSVNTATLSNGTYNGTITISAAGAANSPRSIPVSLTLSQSPLIVLGPTSLSFNATAGGANPSSQTVNVTNGGSGTLNGLAASVSYQGGQPTGWLGASLNTGTAPAVLTLSAVTGSLSAGTYTATVSVTSPVAPNSPQNVTVTFTVAAPTTIAVSPTSFTFSAQAGGANPANQVLTVSNSGSGTLNWGVSEPVNWLSLSPTGGTQTGNVTLSVNTAGLSMGTFQTTITVSANAANSPVQVPVTLQLSAPAQYTMTIYGAGAGSGTVTSSPAGINCTITAGTPSGDCTEGFTPGTVVTLTETPAAGSVFYGWIPIGCGSATTCQITMDTDKAPQARFDVAPVNQITVNPTSVSLTVYPQGGLQVNSPVSVLSGSGVLSAAFGPMQHDCPILNPNDITLAMGPAAPTTLTITINTLNLSFCTINTSVIIHSDLSPNVTDVSIPLDIQSRLTPDDATATTLPATNITQTTATLNAQTTGTLYSAYIQYDTDPNLASATTVLVGSGASGTQNWQLPITGLTPGTTYYFRVVADVLGDCCAHLGTILSFTTLN